MKQAFIERRVLVCFKKDVSDDIIKNYFNGIDELRNATSDLMGFELHKFEKVNCEENLAATVTNVTFPDVMTTWKFRNEQALEAFLQSNSHRVIAKEKFKPAVDHRIVFNSKIL